MEPPGKFTFVTQPKAGKDDSGALVAAFEIDVSRARLASLRSCELSANSLVNQVCLHGRMALRDLGGPWRSSTRVEEVVKIWLGDRTAPMTLWASTRQRMLLALTHRQRPFLSAATRSPAPLVPVATRRSCRPWGLTWRVTCPCCMPRAPSKPAGAGCKRQVGCAPL